MDKIFVIELNNFFIDTIQRCTYDLIDKDDETIAYELFEEFDIGANSFLHPASLELLIEENFIDKEIKESSLRLREMFLSLAEDKLNTNSVRNDKEWHDILKLSDSLRERKCQFDLEKHELFK